MDKTLTAIVLLIAALASTTPTASAPPRVDALVRPYVQLNAFSGVVLAARGDHVLFQQAYGMADAEFGVPNTVDTRFAIASITKRFTSVILQKLFDEKRLSQDDSLARWVPDFPSADAITVGELMRHRSGLADPERLRGTIRANYSSDEIVDVLKRVPLASKPGEAYSYTTANYAILAHIIERVTGKPYADVARQYVFGPARMADSGELTTTTVVPRLAHGYMPDPFGRGLSVSGPEDTSWKVGGGSSYSTAGDLLRFVRALYRGVLLPAPEAFSSWEPPRTMFGKRFTRLNGGFPGTGASVLYFPDDEVTVVVLSNNYAAVAPAIAGSIAAVVFDQRYEVAGPAIEKAPEPPEARLEGSYRVENMPWRFSLAIREGRAMTIWSPFRMSPLLRMSADTWFEPLDWSTLQMKFDDRGQFVEGWLSSPGSEPAKVVRQ